MTATATRAPALGPPAVDDPRIVILRSAGWELGVLPATGASIAFGRILVDGEWLDMLRPTRPGSYGRPERCASFPLIPWSNRIRDGILTFRGRTWQLPRNAADGTAIHGAVLEFAWRVVGRTTTSVELELDTTDLTGVNFPWRFRSRISYALTESSLAVTTTIENIDSEPFPAGFGHHPYFQRHLLPGRPDAVLQIPAERGYTLDHAIAVGPAADVPVRADYRSPRPLGSVFVDDVLTARRPGEPVRIRYPEQGVDVRLDADDAYEHIVVYVPRGRSYFAVEPVTNVNGGFALHDAGVPGTGVFVLEPGQVRAATFTIGVDGLG
ncbi:MAG: aldose epimerase [Cellulomonas sp.]